METNIYTFFTLYGYTMVAVVFASALIAGGWYLGKYLTEKLK